MSFDMSTCPLRIAIVGAGISGLAAAYCLAGAHRVTIFESAGRPGGHARTVIAGKRGDQPVDTGFIVFNHVNYPGLTAMFEALDVQVEKSDMSFAASIDDGRVEYGLQTLHSLTSQKRNLLSPFFYGMIGDILRFNSRASRNDVADHLTMGEYLDDLRMGRWFRDYYLTPLCGAIWSTPPRRTLDFPAAALIRFFRNHHLLTTRGQHQWRTVSGGSISYVTRLVGHLERKLVDIRCDAPVRQVERRADSVWIRAEGGLEERFDQVIFACHPDQALATIADPTHDERRLLGAIGYRDNRMVLHRDPAHMPKRRSCWSSWVYRARKDEEGSAITYWMNRLQNIPQDDPLFVTLNPIDPVREDFVYDEHVFRHPVFDHAALSARREVEKIQGRNRTWFAGAWLGHGFHEDGHASAVAVARALNRVPI